MAFAPVANWIDNIYLTKNGTYLQEADIRGFVTVADMTRAISDSIINDDLQNMPACHYRNPPGTNPAIMWGDWTTFVSSAGDTGNFNDSYTLDDLFSDVGDVVLFHSHEAGDAYGWGYQLYSDSGTQRSYHPVMRYGGYTQVFTGTSCSSGVDASGRKRDFYWGVMMDDERHQALPFSVTAAYHSPVQTGDSANVLVPVFSGATLTSALVAMYILFKSVYVPPAPSSDPYAPGGTSEPSEPTGTFTPTEDDVEPPSAPTFNLGISKLLTAYVCDLTDINNFATYMWANAASLAGIDKVIFGNVGDCVLSVHMLPLAVPHEATASTVTVGNYPTSVQLKRATVQFVDVDCGSVNLAPFWASYLDFNPLCKMTLVLPYIGEVSLDPDEVLQEQGGVARTTSLSVLYRVDILTGSLVAYVTATRLKTDGSTQYKVLIGQYAGTCSLSVPVTQADFTQVKNALMQAAVATISLAATAATGGLTAPEAIGAAGSAVVSTANNIGNGKLRISHSGGLAGSAGFMGYQTPYLIIKRVKQSLPEGYNAYRGYPLNVTTRIGDLEGFTAVSDAILDGIPLTDEELSELRTLLQGGVYI